MIDTLAHVRGFLTEGDDPEFFPPSRCVHDKTVMVAWDRKTSSEMRRVRVIFEDKREFVLKWQIEPEMSDKDASLHLSGPRRHGESRPPRQETFTYGDKVYVSLKSAIRGLKYEI